MASSAFGRAVAAVETACFSTADYTNGRRWKAIIHSMTRRPSQSPPYLRARNAPAPTSTSTTASAVPVFQV